MYAIVDIETTGSAAAYGKITEIAILIHDGKRVIDEYQTLINPECGIPMGITSLTGISNEMVMNAPKFYEVAKEIHQMLEGNIFVAHNVNFDYSFIKKEFVELGGTLSLPKLCTVRLSRKIFPGLKSYSLGRLADHFQIENAARHRAMGDARATAELMDLLIADDSGQIQEFLKKNSKESDLPPNLPKETFANLPALTGVYYFHDDHGKVLYVGKANNIKSRVRNHFSSSDVIYKQGLKDQIYDITFELCGDEMIAFLFESFEIKRLFPPFNKAQKYPSRKYGIYHYEDSRGFHRLSIGKVQKGHIPLKSFTSFDKARTFLIQFVKDHNLDPELCSLPASMMKYFGYSFEVSDEETLKERFKAALAAINDVKNTYCLFGDGRTIGEKSVVLVEEGLYKGFGFFDEEVTGESLNQVKDLVKSYPDNPDVHRIINQYIDKREIVVF
ncbi:exonuclease domain-containing protein [Roseivirga sp.]|uniref:exonuclease domain-containing protein n=1 Tax=Roseivirga sp. TaxID=1964215 RepID=UPI003B8DDFB3